MTADSVTDVEVGIRVEDMIAALYTIDFDFKENLTACLSITVYLSCNVDVVAVDIMYRECPSEGQNMEKYKPHHTSHRQTYLPT